MGKQVTWTGPKLLAYAGSPVIDVPYIEFSCSAAIFA